MSRMKTIDINTIIDKGYFLIATCRSHEEYTALKANQSIFSLLGNNTVQFGRVSDEIGKQIASETDVELPKRFDGNIGSLFVDLVAMENRFVRLAAAEKSILRATKKLYMAGIFEDKEVYSLERIRIISDKSYSLVEGKKSGKLHR